eukprot:CAMPEP_0175863000 /NCGR_PEP_ID=MMETSP0107_2-20121207/32255_1 /TAXON_ID=195067 ORGANISM="Goniomonas pacifica, Strain CCMP1869" /NCGR_SAMPLE_ID=MMETSP0107_2 /ASSEMBLY_ACC=CAM_ASM_000203 /LENGTH=44 /DNA_ID= /DNA_START= /DNA_END= /DNA_ORIENTATION=
MSHCLSNSRILSWSWGFARPPQYSFRAKSLGLSWACQTSCCAMT